MQKAWVSLIPFYTAFQLPFVSLCFAPSPPVQEVGTVHTLPFPRECEQQRCGLQIQNQILPVCITLQDYSASGEYTSCPRGIESPADKDQGHQEATLTTDHSWCD